MTDTLPLSIQPVISYPKEAEIGKTYLMEIDLQMPESGFEWQYEEEEYLIYCMVNAGNLFTVTSVGESAIVLHRFGGTYGAAKFFLKSALEESMGEIKITMVNIWGFPIRVIDLPKIQIRSELSDIYSSPVMPIMVTNSAEAQAKEEISHTPSTPITPIREINPPKILTKEKIPHTPSTPIKKFINQKKYSDTKQNSTLFGDKPVVVTMLGSIGSGKTCYISSMYSRLTHGRDLSGYYLTANRHDDSIKLLSVWEQIVRERESGAARFPEATQTNDEYSFTVKYGLHEPIIMFDWLDYGGGAIPASNDAPNRQQLLKRLKETDCLILCISGENLKDPITDENREEVLYTIDAHYINSLIGEVQRTSRNAPPSIAIIVTQYDRCKLRDSGIFEDIKQIFPILFESNGWLVMICPVTLGLGLADSLSAPVNPINVHIPIVFSLLSKMIRIQWASIGQSQINQDVSTIRGAFRTIENVQPHIDRYTHSKLAKKLKQEIIRMSSVITRQKPNSIRFSTYLNGKQITWEDLLGDDINLD